MKQGLHNSWKKYFSTINENNSEDCKKREDCECIESSVSAFSLEDLSNSINTWGLDPNIQMSFRYPIDNTCDENTKAAIMQFQKHKNIPCTGCVDKETEYELKNLVKKNSSASSPIGSPTGEETSSREVHFRTDPGTGYKRKRGVYSRVLRYKKEVKMAIAKTRYLKNINPIVAENMIYAIIHHSSRGIQDKVTPIQMSEESKKQQVKLKNFASGLVNDAPKFVIDRSKQRLSGKDVPYAEKHGLMQLDDTRVFLQSRSEYLNPITNIEKGVELFDHSYGRYVENDAEDRPFYGLMMAFISYQSESSALQGLDTPLADGKNTMMSFYSFGGFNRLIKDFQPGVYYVDTDGDLISTTMGSQKAVEFTGKTSLSHLREPLSSDKYITMSLDKTKKKNKKSGSISKI